MTSVTLLVRVKDPQNQEAWRRFLARYRPRVLAWCREKGLSESDAEEVTQVVLLKLLDRLQSFVYQPGRGRFRAWLRTVTINTWKDFLRDNAKHRNAVELFPSDELAEAVTEEFDRELLEIAIERVRPQVEPRNWRCFEMRVFEERPSRDVGAQLDMTVAAVNMAKSRIQKLLKQEMEALLSDEEAD